MKKFLFGFLIAVVLIIGAYSFIGNLLQPEPVEAIGYHTCHGYFPNLVKWSCPDNSMCGHQPGECIPF